MSEKRVVVLGASGTIGRATVDTLVAQDVSAIAVVRSTSNVNFPADVDVRVADVTNRAELEAHVFDDGKVDAVISCLAARTGVPSEAWAIDHQANIDALDLAKSRGVETYVLLSAICVQKPQLQFQFAKLAFEEALAKSGLTYAIVRPTAYFKSLSGQIDRLRAGKPFLLFGDGQTTACKPIAAEDLAEYLIGCLFDPDRQNKILPIGGPGDALTPRAQGELLFDVLGRPARFKHVPFSLFDGIVFVLGALGRVSGSLANKAELARIGRYYATESMLVFDPETRAYRADLTPSFGKRTLEQHYRKIIDGEQENERADVALF